MMYTDKRDEIYGEREEKRKLEKDWRNGGREGEREKEKKRKLEKEWRKGDRGGERERRK